MNLRHYFKLRVVQKNAMLLLSKATAMTRKCNENKEGINTFDGALKVMEEKLQKLV